MNVGNIEDIIRILKIPKTNLGMRWWQEFGWDRSICFSLESLHACETAACLGGTIAVSERFQEAGGEICPVSGSPLFEGYDCEYAIASWFGISATLATRVCYIRSKDTYYDVPREDVTKEMVIKKLEEIIEEGDLF